MTVTERLYMLLKEQGKTSSQLCRWLGIENNVIAGWKKKNDIPPSKYLVNICEFLGITVDYLLTGKSEDKPQPEVGDEAQIVERDFHSPFWDLLTEDERELLSMYGYLSKEGKTWARYIIKGYLKEHENLSSSRQLGTKHESGRTA